ncbi:hypothetical protein A3G56_00540 [Candidatus Falkowbacteria bacterium RIFCSPLOWO2_12_FULL_45_10]|uniref:Glycosyltransferase subfamily 4-like N-terminal domain-containing protein n=1 Tax=Candidatus Falkowbacteria bacterium RIFCSPLOWO2_12_FULL_45_10 TaxID=1797990 RepID=A0A1F5RZN4_9BACT|nr:MAG: hypothetical protein A3G56_00540 [Candidatus Falkowbacteria bacterium RIFCSPLOWO2_12_FULL_45_10]
MLKILYLVTQSDFGGAQRYVYDLATNLSENFTIVVAGGEQGYEGELVKKLNKSGIRYLPLSHLKRVISPWHDWSAFWQIVHLIQTEKPDIVHLNSSKISILGSLAAWWCKVPKIIYTVHGWVFSEDLPLRKKYFYKILEKLTARFKTDIICLSEWEKQNTVRRQIAPAKKISVIYNGIAPINFLPRAEARAQLAKTAGAQIDDQTILIGSIGNLYKNKGYEYLIEAIKISNIPASPAGRQYPISNIKLIIIGSGPEQNNLQLQINNYELQNKIILTGSIGDAAQLLSAFDIYVCSSVKEGLPYSILEAMQAGLPIVATPVGAIPEIITDGQTGLLVKSGNAAALADKLSYALNRLSVSKQIGVEANKQVIAKYALRAMIKETANLYSR